MTKPKRYQRVVYYPPRGDVHHVCKFIQAVDTHNGVWWELKREDGTMFRARPGACMVG